MLYSNCKIHTLFGCLIPDDKLLDMHSSKNHGSVLCHSTRIGLYRRWFRFYGNAIFDILSLLTVVLQTNRKLINNNTNGRFFFFFICLHLYYATCTQFQYCTLKYESSQQKLIPHLQPCSHYLYAEDIYWILGSQ